MLKHSRIDNNSYVTDADIQALIIALANNKAVGYIGAGPSIDAGLPSWDRLLAHCLERASTELPFESKSWEKAAKLLASGDFLTVAELLQRGLGSRLDGILMDIFSNAATPSPIHLAIARMPFSMVLTTNYDRLIENAFSTSQLVCTWREPEAVFSAIKNFHYAIVKTHGDVGKRSTTVLTKTQYRDLMYLNHQFNLCIRMLLTLRTFLFVGTSLRDPDLFHIIDEARLMHGEDFGPHYAIMFGDEIDKSYSDFLKETYSIHTIYCMPGENGKFEQNEKSSLLTNLLIMLAGKANLERHERMAGPALDDPTFCTVNACETLLANAVEFTGSVRGDIGLISDGLHHSPSIVCSTPPKTRSNKPSLNGTPVPADSIAGRVFLRNVLPQSQVIIRDKNGKLANATTELTNAVYVRDVENPEVWLSDQQIDGAKYYQVDSDIRSQITAPINSDGKRVGVLNLESDMHFGYSKFHVRIAERFADQIGWIHYETLSRTRSTISLEPLVRDMKLFNRLMKISRTLRYFDVKFLLWSIDYYNGKLIPNSEEPSLSKTKLEYDFNSKSLATKVLLEKLRIIIPNADAELANPDTCLAPNGCHHFGIHGALMAAPLNCRGNTSAILISWTNEIFRPAERATVFQEQGVSIEKIDERVFRIAHLVVNDPSLTEEFAANRSQDFLQELEKTSMSLNYPNVDKFAPWPASILEDQSARDLISQNMIMALTHKSCGLGRVRLWIASEDGFAIWRSFTAEKFTTPNKEPLDAYAKELVKLDDPYVAYSLARKLNNPYAISQHWKMIGKKDENAGRLNKHPDCPWIVGLVCSKSELIGFLSCDNCLPGESLGICDDSSSEQSRVFQRYAVDVVTHILAPVLRMEIAARKGIVLKNTGDFLGDL